MPPWCHLQSSDVSASRHPLPPFISHITVRIIFPKAPSLLPHCVSWNLQWLSVTVGWSLSTWSGVQGPPGLGPNSLPISPTLQELWQSNDSGDTRGQGGPQGLCLEMGIRILHSSRPHEGSMPPGCGSTEDALWDLGQLRDFHVPQILHLSLDMVMGPDPGWMWSARGQI